MFISEEETKDKQSYNNGYLREGNKGYHKVIIMLIYEEETTDRTKL